MPSTVGTLRRVEEGDTWYIHHWRVKKFLNHNLNKDGLCSDFFLFTPFSLNLVKLYAAKVFITNCYDEETNSIEVGISGPYNCFYFYGRSLSIKISVVDRWNQTLQSAKCILTDGIIETMDRCRLLLGSIRDTRHLLNSKGSLDIRCEVRTRTSEASLTAFSHSERCLTETRETTHDELKFGEAQSVGTVHDQSESTKKTWNLPDFGKLAEKERNFCSGNFAFGTRLWQLHISSPPGRSEVDSGASAEVLLSLKTVSGHETFSPFSWILSINSDNDTVLRSADGVCEDADKHVTFPLGCLPDVQAILGSDGIMRVVCELRLLKEIRDTSHAESKSEVGTDILMRDFKKLLISGESSDATVRVKGEQDFTVHRSVLVARTPVFAAIFRHDMTENATGIINIADCEPDTFERFLQHVYTGRVEDLRPENAISLYKLSDKYQVDELKSECLQCIKEGLSLESFCPIITLALQHCEAELTRLATEFFANNMRKIIQTVEWQNFLSENPTVANELLMKALELREPVA